MIVKKIEVPLYDITLELIQLFYPEDTYEGLIKHIKHYGIDKELNDGFKDNFNSHAINGGITCSRLNTHEIFIVFYPFDNEDRMTVVYDHEKRHTEDRILRFCLIDDREAAAYLAGWLGLKFTKFQNNALQKFKSNPKFRPSR